MLLTVAASPPVPSGAPEKYSAAEPPPLLTASPYAGGGAGLGVAMAVVVGVGKPGVLRPLVLPALAAKGPGLCIGEAAMVAGVGGGRWAMSDGFSDAVPRFWCENGSYRSAGVLHACVGGGADVGPATDEAPGQGGAVPPSTSWSLA